MKKKKVAILHNIISPHVIPLFERLGKQKEIEVKVFFCSESEGNRIWDTDVGDKFTYKILPKFKIEIHGRDLFTYFINPTVIFELAKYNPDIVISAGWDLFSYQLALFYAKIFGKKFILWSGSTQHEPSWRRILAMPLVKLMVAGSDAYIVYGTRAKEYLISLGAKPEKIFIAYNTTDINFFKNEVDKWREQKTKIKKELGIKTSKVVLYVGQLIERKGVKYLIEAFEKLKEEFKDVSLLIVGYGSLEDKLKSMIKRRKISDVIFAGGLEWRQTPKFYAISDILVMPSLEEVWGLVINEAMVAGLPVIVTKITGASVDMIVNNENGLIINPSSSNEIYNGIKRLLNDALLFNMLSKNSLKKIIEFKPEISVKGILKAINYAIK